MDDFSGLKSLKQMAEAKSFEGVGKATHFRVDPRIIEIEPGFNIRFTTPKRRAYIDSLKAARRQGAKLPVLDVRVEPGRIIMVDGHNRLQADLELIEEGFPIETVECREFTGNDAECTVHMVSTGQQGLKVSQLESGHGFRRLINWGWSISRIALRTGLSDTYVEQGIMLAEADTAIQQMLVDELVAAHVVIDVLRKHGKNALAVLQEALAKERSSGGSKVTVKALHGPSLPRPVVTQVVESLDAFYSNLTDDDRSRLETLLVGNDAELAGEHITLPASSVRALLEARQNVQQVFHKAEEKLQRRRQRAAKKAQTGADATQADQMA